MSGYTMIFLNNMRKSLNSKYGCIIQFTMCNNNVSNFIEDICSDVRKIVETVFKNDKQDDVDRIRLKSYKISLIDEIKFLAPSLGGPFQKISKEFELKFTPEDRDDYSIVIEGIVGDDEFYDFGYGFEVEKGPNRLSPPVNNLPAVLECSRHYADMFKNAVEAEVHADRTPLHMKTLIDRSRSAVAAMDCPVVLGVDITDDSPFAFELTKDRDIIVAGELTPRMNGILTIINSITHFAKTEVEFFLVETCAGTFDRYRLDGESGIFEILKSPETILQRLRKVVRHCKNLRESDNRHKTIVVIDDLDSLFNVSKDYRKKIRQILKTIMYDSDIHLIVGISDEDAFSVRDFRNIFRRFRVVCQFRNPHTKYEKYLININNLSDMDSDDDMFCCLDTGDGVWDIRNETRFARLQCASWK